MTRLRRACTAIALGTSIALPAAGLDADVVLDWNVIALKTTAAAAFNPPLETRNLAIVHAAIFDAVNAIGRQFHPFAVRLRAPGPASAEAAGAAAAHAALVYVVPSQPHTSSNVTPQSDSLPKETQPPGPSHPSAKQYS